MKPENFVWHAARAHLRACLDQRGPAVATNGAFRFGDARWLPPAVLPRPVDGESPVAWIARLPDDIGSHFVVLLRAGSAALGVFDDAECHLHRCLRRYVVRGNGKAQTTWLRTRGKSRYGSRLRLQNADRLLGDVAETTAEWSDWIRAATAVHWSSPQRQWAALFGNDPSPAIDRADPRLRKIKFHVHEPRFDELERAWWRLRHGRFEAGSASQDDDDD